MPGSAPTRWRATVLLQADASQFKQGILDPQVSKTGTQVLDLVACGGGKPKRQAGVERSGFAGRCWLGDSRGQLQAVLSPLMCSLGRGPSEGTGGGILFALQNFHSKCVLLMAGDTGLCGAEVGGEFVQSAGWGRNPDASAWQICLHA